jgi:hypothetical protein
VIIENIINERTEVRLRSQWSEQVDNDTRLSSPLDALFREQIDDAGFFFV